MIIGVYLKLSLSDKKDNENNIWRYHLSVVYSLPSSCGFYLVECEIVKHMYPCEMRPAFDLFSVTRLLH